MEVTEVTITTSDVLSVAQAAKELGKHRATLYRWVEDGIIIGIKFAGTLFIPKSEIERVNRERENTRGRGKPCGES